MILMQQRPLKVELKMNEKQKCECGWTGTTADTIMALWIDPIKRSPPPIGDGYNLRCPMCKSKVKIVRYL